MIPIEALLEKNIERLHLHPIYRKRLIPANEDQIRLTNTWILPNLELILTDFRTLRKEVDAELARDPAIILRLTELGETYPYGLCEPIRDAMFSRIKAEIEANVRPGMVQLANFVREGGIIQPFWGIDKGIYFQNAIQIGNTILDAANDTVDPKKEPVVWYPDIAQAVIKSIDTFHEFAFVAERYWKQDVYPNIYLPHLAPAFPMLSIEPVRRPSGGMAQVLTLQTGAGDLQFKNLYTVHDGNLFGLASHFLTESEYAKKRLPDEVLQGLLTNAQLRALQSRNPKAYRLTTNPEDIRVEFAKFGAPPADALVPEATLQAGDRLKQEGLLLTKIILGERTLGVE